MLLAANGLTFCDVGLQSLYPPPFPCNPSTISAFDSALIMPSKYLRDMSCKTLSLWKGLDRIVEDYLYGITLEDLLK